MRGHEDQPSRGNPEPSNRPDLGDEFFEGMVAAASDAVMTVDAEGTIVYANEAVEDLVGYAPDDLLGRSFAEFVPERLRNRYEGWYRRYAETGGDGGSALDEPVAVTWRTAEGDEQHLSVSAFEHREDGERLVTGFFREAPDGDATDERLREEEALVEELFDTSPIAISVRDADGELLRANDRAAELVGVDPDQLSEAVENEEAEVREWSLYDADGNPREHPVRQTLRTGEPLYNEELIVERPNGDRAYLSASVTPIYEDGEIDQVVTAAEDVTELKQTQFELERRRAELETELSEVFARIDDAFFALNDEWEFTYVNDEAEELLDRTEGELLGKTIWEEFPEALGSTFEREYREAMATQEQASFVEYFPPLSTWFEVRAYPSETGLSVYFRDVTERIEREQELERYETIVETVEDGIYIVGADGTFSMVNSSFADLVGYDVEELIGAPPSILYDEETKADVQRLQQEILDGQRSYATVEHPVQTGDGGTFPAETTFVVRETADGEAERVGVTRDITDRKRFEGTLTALHESSRELLQLESESAVCESVLRTTTDVLGIPGAGIYLWDDGASKLVPTAASEHVADIFGDLPAFEPGDEAITWRAFAEGETVTFDDVRETELAYRDDTPLRSGIWIPLGDHGVLAVVSEEVGAFGPDEEKLADLLAATTEAALDRVERERERREHERKLEAQNERLDAFASMLAHELRNPLEIAQIYLGMGVEGVPDDADASAFEEVETALDRIEEMIETLLVVTRRGGEIDTAGIVDLGEVAVEWWERLDLDGSLSVETDRKIRADDSRLRQLLENLYRNAEEHAGPDVTVRVGDLPGGFYVEDDGPGIPAEKRGKVFEPGYSTSSVGIGFGLAVVRQLVEAHDWHCEITESKDGGARFEFTDVDVVEE